jgi:hypothetical protein
MSAASRIPSRIGTITPRSCLTAHLASDRSSAAGGSAAVAAAKRASMDVMKAMHYVTAIAHQQEAGATPGCVDLPRAAD